MNVFNAWKRRGLGGDPWRPDIPGGQVYLGGAQSSMPSRESDLQKG